MACFWQAATGYWMMVAGCLLLGIANGGLLPLLSYLLARSFGPANLGRVSGLVTLATLPLNLAAPPVFGLIFDRTGSYDLALIGFICLSLLATLLVPHIRSRARNP